MAAKKQKALAADAAGNAFLVEMLATDDAAGTAKTKKKKKKHAKKKNTGSGKRRRIGRLPRPRRPSSDR